MWLSSLGSRTGRVDVITEAVLHWNEGKARELARSLVDRYVSSACFENEYLTITTPVASLGLGFRWLNSNHCFPEARVSRRIEGSPLRSWLHTVIFNISGGAHPLRSPHFNTLRQSSLCPRAQPQGFLG